jgi:hypothetical protein
MTYAREYRGPFSLIDQHSILSDGGAHAFEGAFCLDPIRRPHDGLQLSESQPDAREIPCRQAGNWLEVNVGRGILATRQAENTDDGRGLGSYGKCRQGHVAS